MAALVGAGPCACPQLHLVAHNIPVIFITSTMLLIRAGTWACPSSKWLSQSLYIGRIKNPPLLSKESV